MMLAEMRVVYKTKVPTNQREIIRNSSDLNRCFLHLWPQDNIEYWEECYLICLNRRNAVIGYAKVGQGGLTGTVVDLRVIMAIALKVGATAIAIAHNHPSGNLSPSSADHQITRRLSDAAKIMDIVFSDHLIITPDGYYSFADGGNL